MKNTTIVFGILFILLGVIAYIATGSQSITALIPAFFGIPILIFGIIAGNNEKWRKHLIHGAVALTLLGFLGSFSGILNLVEWLGGNEIARPAAAIAQSIMALLCLIYLIMGIQSFIAARKKS